MFLISPPLIPNLVYCNYSAIKKLNDFAYHLKLGRDILSLVGNFGAPVSVPETVVSKNVDLLEVGSLYLDMQNEKLIRQQLLQYLNNTRLKNPSYSLRAMARSFNTSPAQLSQVFSGKRPMTNNFKKKVLEKLGLPAFDSQTQFGLIKEDSFKLVADWYHFAILSLSKVKDSKADARWISNRLGIDYFVAKEAFERLQNLKLIKIEGGKFSQISQPVHTTNDVPSEAIRRHHKQNLRLATEKIDDIDVNYREFSSITVATSLKKLPIAKEAIRKFKSEMFELLECGPKEEVFTFAIQLFPVSKIKKGDK